ncbi:MAG TPA: GDSL-type esterase/lipase family protein [Cryptosporangiaceae bacterium]|nr:GDSL-type esterase/lipase family protein [Cryptosporangiaceae bacterium]
MTLPASIAALGDSITRAFAVCESSGDCPQASWSTGTAPDLGSHQQRVTEARGRRPQVHNLAVSGATVSGLDGQARKAVATKAEYVTVLIGANDACAPTERAMTPVAEFETAFVGAMDTLVRGLPQARVLVVSIPDLARLWVVGKGVEDVRATWGKFGICQSMLADPTSTSDAANARRARVRDRVIAYNRVMAAACQRHPTCRWDGNAVFDYDFSLDMVSPRDYWHPSMLGQRTLAEISWKAGYWA